MKDFVLWSCLDQPFLYRWPINASTRLFHTKAKMLEHEAALDFS